MLPEFRLPVKIASPMYASVTVPCLFLLVALSTSPVTRPFHHNTLPPTCIHVWPVITNSLNLNFTTWPIKDISNQKVHVESVSWFLLYDPCHATVKQKRRGGGKKERKQFVNERGDMNYDQCVYRKATVIWVEPKVKCLKSMTTDWYASTYLHNFYPMEN